MKTSTTINLRAVYAAEYSWTQFAIQMVLAGEHKTHLGAYQHALTQVSRYARIADGLAPATTH